MLICIVLLYVKNHSVSNTLRLGLLLRCRVHHKALPLVVAAAVASLGIHDIFVHEYGFKENFAIVL